MKREILRGLGIQGMRIDLNVCDMFAANQVANELKTVITNHANCEEYKNTPYDKRKGTFPGGEPKRIEVSEKTLQNIYKMMCKFSHESKSTLFEDEDENEDDEQPF